MGTTPTYSWPYPEPTDPVADGAQNIEDLALAIESTLTTAATAFTPSWTGLTPGDASEDWVYWRLGNIVVVRGQTVFGSTTSVTGTLQLDLPVGTIANIPSGLGLAFYRRTGTDDNLGYVLASSTTTVLFRVHNTSGTYLDYNNVAASTPFVWTSSSRIACQFVYGIE